jgi:hypothetical protein
MRARTPATATLEILQDAAYRQLGRVPLIFDLNRIEEDLQGHTGKIGNQYLDEFLERLGITNAARRMRGMRQVTENVLPNLAKVREIVDKLPTKYENPFYFLILDYAHKQIQETVEALRRGGRTWSHASNPVIV